jgi:conjugative relaxase-like TrwC/TraI family protein
MISVGIVSSPGIAYYVETVASGIDDYYVRTEPGSWYGRGATGLGLAGVVSSGAIEALAVGAHPVTGEPLGANRGKVAAYDLTFSAPKSVSVLAEVATDPTVRAAVLDAHHAAVTETVGLLEPEAVRGRRGHAGAVVVRTAGMVAAGFDHHTSRAGDPQLHTHLLVANRALGADGRWGALDGRRLYAWAKTSGYAYQAALRAQLTARLGIGWGPVVNGIADVRGVPADVLTEFATRRAQIVAALDRAGASSPRAAQVATLVTRPAKADPIDPDQQRQAWQDRARAAGLDPDDLTPAGLSPGRATHLVGIGRPVAAPDAEWLATVLAAPSGLTAQRSSFDRRAVLQAVAASAIEGAAVTDLVRVSQAIVRDDRFVATGAAGHLAGSTWTTVELAAVEARLLAGVDRRRQAGIAIPDPRAVNGVLADRSLSDEQAAMVRSVTTSGHGVEVVVGPAGTGKTTALDAARAAWAASGIDVIGTALAARTALALEAGAGIPTATVDQLLADLARPGLAAWGVLPAGGVLIVDEAGMVGTRKLEQLLTAAERSRTKVLLVGDPRQLPEIEAGGAFAALAARHPAVTLTTNRRQVHAWERDALAQVRDGRPAAAVIAYHEHGRLTLTATADEARDRLVADWANTGASSTDGHGKVMVALTRADVVDLNTRALDRLEANGVLDPDRPRLTVGDRSYGIGEQVMALRNDRRAGIVNGTTGTVIGIDADGLTVRPDQPDAATVTIAADYIAAGHLTHGWATTAHKAQGVTTGQAYLLGTDRLYREAGYVALSRATERTDWYQAAPIQTAWAPPAIDAQADLTRLLTRSNAQQLATVPTPAGQDAAGTERARAAVLADPGQQLTDALGPPPLSGPGRDRWATTALTVETYRHRHGIDGPDPLGPAPRSLGKDNPAGGPDRHDGVDPYREWVLARTAIDQTRRQLGRDLDLDRGLGL